MAHLLSRGSLEEVINYLMISFELGYLSKEVYNEVIQKADSLVQLINGYIAYLKRTKAGDDDLERKKAVSEKNELYEIEDSADDIHMEIDF